MKNCKFKLIVGALMMGICISEAAVAGYPAFESEYICNGYPQVEGVVDIVTATQTYSASYGVYIRVKGDDNKVYGGQIYQRSNTDFAYKHMVNLATIAYITKVKVKLCYNGSGSDAHVYALGLMP